MKKGKIIGLLVISAVLLTGCIDSMPELTSEQSDMIAEYAASLILKYSPDYDYKIASEAEVAAAMQEMSETETQLQEESEADTLSVAASPDTEETAQERETETTDAEEILPADEVALALELGLDNLVLRYQSFELCDSYPQDSEGFNVTAAQGKKLLVLHFDLEGETEEDVDCDLFDHGLRIRLTVNGTTSVTALSTLLPNELMSFMDTIPAGESVGVVAVAEIDDMTENEITDLTLRISSNDGTCMVKLK